MSDPRQKKQLKLLGVLLAVLLLVLYWTWGGGPSATPTSPGRLPSASLGLEDFVLRTGQQGDSRTRRKGIPVSEINSSIHFEKLGQMETVQPSLARNMFAFYTPPSPNRTSGSTSQESPGEVRSQPIAPALTPSASRNSEVIPLKFYGFREDQPGKRRQGFFADGDAVFLAWEGELIANRYRIHRITDTMAEVEEVKSETRKQLNLEMPSE